MRLHVLADLRVERIQETTSRKTLFFSLRYNRIERPQFPEVIPLRTRKFKKDTFWYLKAVRPRQFGEM
jgi:hypothetical protein